MMYRSHQITKESKTIRRRRHKKRNIPTKKRDRNVKRFRLKKSNVNLRSISIHDRIRIGSPGDPTIWYKGVCVVRKGERITLEVANILHTLKMKPFQTGLEIKTCFDFSEDRMINALKITHDVVSSQFPEQNI